MSKDKAGELSTRFNTMGVNDQLEFLGATFAVLGRDSEIVYDQLRTNGTSGSQAIAGQAMAYGDKLGAKLILQGNDIRLNLKDETNEISGELEAEFRTLSDEAFGGNPSHKKALEEAYVSAYLGLAQSKGYRYDQVIKPGMFSSEPDLSARAFKIVTGGVIEQGNTTIAAPNRDITQEGWGNWIDTLHHSAVKDMGGIVNMDDKQFLDNVRSGLYPLEDTDKPGEYLVKNEDDFIFKNREGNTFIFKYGKYKVRPKLNRRGRRGTVGKPAVVSGGPIHVR
ncbi:MAG: hypothetical protein DRI24_20665 [Deltaproteobacteria bacterium]|nr:MAG: hypothetical protein DRI24_20665 [Deltaproteobacteria bacterium]